MQIAVKYRPKKFSKVVGNEKIIYALKKCIVGENKPHAILLSGPTGVGKTTLGRITSSKLGSRGRDYIELNLSKVGEGSKQSAKEIEDSALYPPFESDVKVFLLDECQESSSYFQNSILKILEEPPNWVYFIFCTTDPDKLKETIRGRCRHFKLVRLTQDEVITALKRIVRLEGVKVKSSLLREIAYEVNGDCRSAIEMLATAFDVPEFGDVLAKRRKEIESLAYALYKQMGWKKISKILNELEGDIEYTRRGILNYMERILLSKRDDWASDIMMEMSDSFKNEGRAGLTNACYNCVFREATRRT